MCSSRWLSTVLCHGSKPFSSSRFHILQKWNRRKLILTWNLERTAAESAASNERLVQVSNKRITSFVGFQKISGYLSAHSAAPPQPPTFHRWRGRGFGADPLGFRQGRRHFHPLTKTNLIHMENCILTFQLALITSTPDYPCVITSAGLLLQYEAGEWIHLICQN